MFFTLQNNKYLSPRQLRTSTLMSAYYIINSYPLRASDKILNDYLQMTYKTSLKNICIKLLLNISFLKDTDGNFVLLFKDPALDKLAQLITYGNGAIPGSKILQIALKNK